MPVLHLLGTGAALSSGARTTTMLAVAVPGSVLLIDCGGDAAQRMLAQGIALDELEAVVLTHEHPDHIGGFPLLVERLWLAGRRHPLPVHGPEETLKRARRLWETFDTSGWEGVPELEWQPVALEQSAKVLTSDAWRVTAAPGEHSVPSIALRCEHRGTESAVAYSADTRPTGAVVRLAAGADLLVHEATGGEGGGHSSAEAAAEIAAEAGVARLVLVHLPPETPDLEMARRSFTPIELGEDGGRYDF